ncbi:hypothetical protein ID866_1418 [Astraeus odoratus]|nr:hypothetical protein ID866_1418 [Astraeus odoratus]
MSFPYATVLTPVTVPAGFFPIEVVQFWRGERAPGQPFPLHWALFVRISGWHGNYYHVLGNIDTFMVVIDRNKQQRDTELWRGSHTVGYVAPHHLAALEAAVCRVPIVRHDPNWNGQKWVSDALRTLRSVNILVDPEVTMAKLQTQMASLLEAWENGEI